jgi:branched-chain amino acid transport system ATP-binding protein
VAPVASKTTPAVLSMKDVVAGYQAHDRVLNHVSLEVQPGRVTVVLGPNGSGKSTVLRVLAGFLGIREGEVLLGDEPIAKLTVRERVERGLSLLPQGRSVFPGLTVEENLRLGAWLWRDDRERMNAAVDATFERYPKLVPLRKRQADSLSGGQARLLEFGRSLILDPSVLLIDEPSVGLAPVLVDDIYEEISRLKAEGRTILLVDQNVRAAVSVADYIYTLTYGSNHLDGAVGEFTGSLDGLIKQWLSL